MSTSPVANLLRPELSELSAYAPDAGDFRIRLDANEAPGIFSDEARGRLAEAAARLSFERYPDASVQTLREALADRTGVTPEEILTGVGSDELIALLVTALSNPRERHDAPVVLTTTPTFGMYAMSARVRGQRVLEVPLDKDWDLSLSGVLAALRVAEPSVIFIASPNNPTGNKMRFGRLSELVEAAPRSLVVIDEAYIDYSDQNQLELYRRHENVAILRTLSKIGFAALRVGWLVARPELVREIDKVRLPYNMPTLSQRLGTVAVTELASEIAKVCALVVAEREKVREALTALPQVEVAPSSANFLWVRSELPAVEIFEGLKQDGILVRSFHARGGRLSRHVRVTLGTPAENLAFVAAFTRLHRAS